MTSYRNIRSQWSILLLDNPRTSSEQGQYYRKSIAHNTYTEYHIPFHGQIMFFNIPRGLKLYQD